jgi:PAS domain S-box-containing protein
LRQGLERGDKVLYIVDQHTAQAILSYLRNDGFDVEPFLDSGQLSVLTHHDAYTRGGSFDPDAMIALLESETEQALAEGYAALRVSGEMSWAVRDLPGSERLIEYEAKLNRFFLGSQCLAICQYDRSRFAPEILLNVLRTHPFAVIGTQVYENFYYVPPDEILDRADAEAQLQRWVRNLVERRRVEEALYESEQTYRTLFQTMAQGIVYQDVEGRITSANPAAERLLGLPLDQMRGRTSTDPRWHAIHEDGSDFPGEMHPSMVALRTGQEVKNVVMGIFNPQVNEYRWINVHAVPQFGPEQRQLLQVHTSFDDITERKQTEDALRRSEERYRTLFENVPVGLYRTTPEGRIVDANPVLAEMLGYPDRESLLEIDAGDFFVKPEDRARESRLLERDGIVRGLEIQMRRRDGEIFWVRDAARIVRDPEGQAVYYEGSLEDITKRKLMEIENEEHVRELQIINDTVLAASRTRDVDEICDLIAGTVCEINPGACVVVSLHDREQDAIRVRAIAGFEDRVDQILDLLGADPRQMAFHPREMGEEIELYKTGRLERVPEGIYQLSTGRIPRIACKAVERLLGVDAVYTVGFALEDEPYGGVILLMPPGQQVQYRSAVETLASHLSVMIQRRQAEEALRESEGRYRSFFKTSRDCVFITSKDGRWIDMNEAAVELFGCDSKEELQAVEIPALYERPSDREAHIRAIERQGYTKEYPVNLRRKDSSVINTLITSVAVRDEHGTVNGFMGTIRDVTERRRARRALRQRAAHLALLSDVGKKIAAMLDLDTVLEDAVRLVQEGFGYDHVGLFILDQDHDQLVMRARAGNFAHLFPPEHRVKMGQDIVGWVAHSGERLLSNDVDAEPRYTGIFSAEAPTRSELAVPVRIGEEIIGVLDVQSSEPGAFDKNDVMVIQTLADQVAVAIENARLFQAERRQRELTEALEEASAIVSSTLELDLVLDRILEQVERVVAGDAFNITLIIAEDSVRVARWRGYEPSEAEGALDASSTPIVRHPYRSRMIASGEPVIVPDIAVSPDWNREVSQGQWRSYVGAPIMVSDLTVGFLNVMGTVPGQFGPQDAQRLKVFARHAAIAIENAQLYQALRSHAHQLEERVKERTAQIQAQYAQLEAILSSTMDGIIVTDAEGEILRVNPVAESWLTQTLPPEEVGQLREMIQDLAMRVEEQPEAVLELESVDLQINAAPIAEPTAEGRAVVALHDVSYLKELDRLKSRFVSNVSHELRTPITSIILYAKLIRGHPQDWDKYIDPLIQEAERQAELVEDILQISRFEAGRLEFKPRTTRLNRLVEESIDSHQVLAERQGLALSHHPVQPEPLVSTDPQRLRQALNNLLENAIRYTPEGGYVVVFTDRQKAEGQTWVTVTVADSGIGIPQDELPHVFERFFRGQEPRRKQISGSGLGLPIVKEIVELHEGHVTVESEVGSGSAFTIWLPLSD